jgi:malonate-semialdehyde dehydrogenase (acetylating)/methylmalonate-semialdehyde dehydrogenase
MAVAQLDALNFIGGTWRAGHSATSFEVFDPATSEKLSRYQSAGLQDVAEAVAAAVSAYPSWRRTPPQTRIQYLFKFRQLLEEHAEEIARTTTHENGKTLVEARAELQRGIENVEVACGIPTLMQGYNLEDIASGIDELMVRQPLGVTAAITPFNFPAMIPLWFLPYAISCGNTFILKPSERVPLTARLLIDLLKDTGLPEGVIGMVTGGREAVDGLLHHPDVRAISFVGSTPVAKYVYAEGSAHGKRVQCQGGAKNYVVVMPDADMATTAKIVTDSAFGCAGQRCLAISAAITVGDAAKDFSDRIVDAASNLNVGNGFLEGVQMGPVISPASRMRVEALIDKGLQQGGKALLDGRSKTDDQDCAFLKPTVLADVGPENELTSTEVFGPVLSIQFAADLDEAISLLSKSKYGNAASIFTSSGAHARKFRYEVPAGNIGVNIGIAAPMAYFPFSGWKDSFLGVVHGQGRDAIDFYTDKKVVIERWPKEWSRKF